MNTQTDREKKLRALLVSDRAAVIREYRKLMNLQGDPSQADEVAEDEMIRVILEREEVGDLRHSAQHA